MEKTTTCKKCHRIIVGTTNLGLCDRCFDKAVDKACLTLGISVGGAAVKKNWPRILQEITRITTKL